MVAGFVTRARMPSMMSEERGVCSVKGGLPRRSLKIMLSNQLILLVSSSYSADHPEQ